MSKLILHPITQTRLTAYIEHPSHAILVTGPRGIGKTAVAKWLAEALLGRKSGTLEQYAHYLPIGSEDGKAIGIEAIRQLEHFTSLKIAGDSGIHRIVLLQDAQLLSSEAQNALLKTLEEPPLDTVIIMTSTQQEALLPTVQSRVQTVEVIPPTREALQQALTSEGVSTEQQAKIIALSGGLPGLALALAKDDQSHPLVQAAQIARQLLQEPTFDKLRQVDVLAKNKEDTQNTLYILMQMAHAALLSGKGSERWQQVLKTVITTQEALNRGVQPKLALTDLMLNL